MVTDAPTGAASGFAFADGNALDWHPSAMAEGVAVKDLGSSDGQTLQLVRFAPGTRFPLHRHAGPEFVYVLDGEAIQKGRRLGPGCAGIAAAGTEEDDFRSKPGCTFLLVYTEE